MIPMIYFRESRFMAGLYFINDGHMQQFSVSENKQIPGSALASIVLYKFRLKKHNPENPVHKNFFFI